MHTDRVESNQLNKPHTNQKPLVAERLAASHERMRFVDICMIPPCQISDKGADFLTHLWYNKSSHESETALGVDAPNAASVTDSRRRATMHNANSTISPDNRIADDPTPDFEPRQILDAAPLPLSFSLPLRSPATGERCQIILVGSPAQWGELMTALVRDGWDYAPPVAWTDGGASS